MEKEFTQTVPFKLHISDDEPAKEPKLIRATLFPYPTMNFDLQTYQTRMQKIRASRTGSLKNDPDEIREYLLNNRMAYLFLGDTEFPGSIITLRCFNDKIMIDTDPDRKDRSLITWSIDNAYYKYVNAIDNYNQKVKSGKIKGNDVVQYTTDEVSNEPVPMLDNDDLMDALYKKIEKEHKQGQI